MLPGHRCPLKTIIRHGTNTANKEIHRDKAWKRPRNGENRTHYRVSGGPMMVTCHSKTLLSSTSPAENPSTGCLARSAPHTPQKRKPQIDQLINPQRKQKHRPETDAGVLKRAAPLSCFCRRRLAWLVVAAMRGDQWPG